MVASAHSLPIRITSVAKSYGSAEALSDVSLDIQAGEFLTLLGPSGSGKTTLLMALAGFVPLDSGSILFGDRDVTLEPPHRRNVGMVFQNYALFPHMTVLGNVAYPLKLRGLTGAEAAVRAEEALSLVQLGGFGERRIHELSGGQQQRVALARSVVFEPPILLMDEPLSALDRKLRETMQAEIRRLHERVGATTVYVTHDQHEALTMSDRVAVLKGGRLQQLDRPDRLYDHPNNVFVADFIGHSHLLPTEVKGGRVYLRGHPVKHNKTPVPNGPLVLMLRPERMEILIAGQDPDMNELSGVVQRHAFVGDALMLTVCLFGETVITVKVPRLRGLLDSVPDPGQPIRLGLHRDDTILLPAEGDDHG
ncbi:ABC transporter ATP-binding protein [Taklimakanibacter deserti]|uniref:ABC transporter ATP-binding protein n=1 Tax=Taklimakanibacter deserti TaxID=2267839 RepID=UPI000E653FB6